MTAPVPADETLAEADRILFAEVEQHHTDIGEPNEFSVPPLPRLGEVLRDAERMIRTALNILGRDIDPASYPLGAQGHIADAGFEVAGFHLEATLRELGDIAALPLPAVGSAVKLSVVSGEQEPAPGSAGARRSAPGESLAGQQAHGAGESSGQETASNRDQLVAAASPRIAPGRTRTSGSECGGPLSLPVDPDPSSGGGAPVPLSGRGAGPGVLGPDHKVWPGTAEIAASINEALTRRSLTRRSR
jgi:hypothetical protein